MFFFSFLIAILSVLIWHSQFSMSEYLIFNSTILDNDTDSTNFIFLYQIIFYHKLGSTKLFLIF